MKKDNTTLHRKAMLRLQLLKKLPKPIVAMETHGGLGKIWQACYWSITEGVVFETNPKKTVVLARQRPGWRVYEGPAERAIAAGVAADMPISLLDCDPYGDPWPVISAFFQSERERAPVLGIAVNDGLRQKLQMSGGWDVSSMDPVVSRFGNGLYDRYTDACRWLMEMKAAAIGYELTDWAAYYCGHAQQMTHYAAVLTRRGGVS